MRAFLLLQDGRLRDIHRVFTFVLVLCNVPPMLVLVVDHGSFVQGRESVDWFEFAGGQHNKGIVNCLLLQRTFLFDL